MTPAFNQIARISTESMLNCILEGIAIGFFAWILLRLVGRRNSSTRFAVWFFALLAIAALPILGVVASSARAGSAGSAIAVPSSWALDIFFAWAAIAGVALVRMSVGFWQLRKLRASCSAIDAATLDPVLRTTLQAFQAVRPVTLCRCDRVRVPTAIGFLRPVVLIPSWAMHELTTAELNSILIHELTHLRRRDDWTNLAQQVLKALLFFHPAVWWIESRLALEREMACDDAVLAQTANPRGYAQCLISVAEKSFMRRGLALAQAAVNRVRQTSMRVSQILDANRSGATGIWKPALYSVAAFVIVCLVWFAHAPELIAFQDNTPNTAIAAAFPATRTTTKPNSFDHRPMATLASFPGKSAGPADRSSRTAKTLIQADASAPLTREGTASAVPQRPAQDSGLHPLRRRSLDEASFATAKSAPSRQPDAQNSATPLNASYIPPNAFISTRALEYDVVAMQTIFVVMQSAQNEQAGPTLWRLSVWRVTILNSTSIPLETRIPAKQI